MRLVTASLIGLLSATALLAQEPVSQDPVTQEREHVVRTGDTLWDLAAYYYDDPYQWRTIYEANTGVVADPHWILPEQVLVIPGVAAGTPRREVAGGPPGTTDPRGTIEPRPSNRPVRTVFYTAPPPPPQSEDPTLLMEPGLRTLPVKEGEFLSAAYLMHPNRLAVRGEFLRSVRDVDPGRGLPQSSHPEDRVYLDYAGERPTVDERLLLVHVGRDVDGARPGERIIHPTGIVRIVALERDLIEAHLEEQFGAVYPGQLAIPMQAFPEFEVEAAEPVEGGSDLNGQILGFVDEQPLYGRTALAILDRGRQHGVREGDVFEAYLPSRTERVRERGSLSSRSERLPPEVVAELRVIRVTDAYATAMVDQVRLPRLGPELPVRRIRKIP